MNKIERAKAHALVGCNLGFSPWAIRFVRAMAWLAEHEPDTVLTAAQKWGLDACVYRYRRQLAGAQGFEIPDEEPRREDYVQAHEARCDKRQAAVESKHGPRPRQEMLFE